MHVASSEMDSSTGATHLFSWLFNWTYDYPTCVEPSDDDDGYKLNYWHPADTNITSQRGNIPDCILDDLGTTDCDSNYEEKQKTAITQRTCIEALKDSNFFCDVMCANDAYILPYEEMKRDLPDKTFNRIKVFHPPGIDDTDRDNFTGKSLYLYLAANSRQPSWGGIRSRLVKSWERFHRDKEPFTCKGAFGEAPENHFGAHYLHQWGAGTWYLVGPLSGKHGHNSNTDARAQVDLARHCHSILSPEFEVEVDTDHKDWRKVHGPVTVASICDNICDGDDARDSEKASSRTFSPVPKAKMSKSKNDSGPSSWGANYWSYDYPLDPYLSSIPNPQCGQPSSTQTFCDAKTYQLYENGGKQIEEM